MRHPACAALVGLLAFPCAAEVVTLKCQTSGAPPVESWLTIDVAANSMRVNGEALPLTVTNQFYSSAKKAGPFTTVRRIDRHTGELVVSMLHGSDVQSSERGACEKATPPATKF